MAQVHSTAAAWNRYHTFLIDTFKKLIYDDQKAHFEVLLYAQKGHEAESCVFSSSVCMVVLLMK